MYCISFRKLLSPMYLICYATAHRLNLGDERGRSYAAADARVEVASCGAAGRVFNGEKMGGGGTTHAKTRAEVTVRLVLFGHEVGDGSDKWTPPGSDTGARDRPVSGCCEDTGARTLGCAA